MIYFFRHNIEYLKEIKIQYLKLKKYTRNQLDPCKIMFYCTEWLNLFGYKMEAGSIFREKKNVVKQLWNRYKRTECILKEDNQSLRCIWFSFKPGVWDN